MTTTLTIIVIIAMLWLAWPRTPKVKSPPRPSLENLRSIREALMQLEQNPDAKRVTVRVKYSVPPQPSITITGHP